MNGFVTYCETWYVENAAGLAEDGLMWVTEASLATLPITALVLGINLLGRRWLSAGQMGLLWCLVFVRLLLPTVPTSPFSLLNFVPSEAPQSADADLLAVAPLMINPLPIAQPAAGGTYPDPVAGELALNSPLNSWIGICELAWLAAAIGIVSWTLAVHWRFCRLLRLAPICRDGRLLRLWDESCDRAGVRGRPAITIFDGVQQPAVMGLFSSELLLPPAALELSDDQLRMIMLHELAHVRRRDLALNWGMVALRAMYWWNPIYWLAAARYRSLREQACDAFVIRTLHGETSRQYGELLLNLAERAPATSGWRVLVPASLLGFCTSFFRRRALRQRFRSLRTAGMRRGRLHTAGVSFLVVLVGICGLTNAEPKMNEAGSSFVVGPPIDLLQGSFAPGFNVNLIPGGNWQGAIEPTPAETPSAPLDVRTYAIAEIAERIKARGLDDGDTRPDMEWLLRQKVEGPKNFGLHPQPAAAIDQAQQPSCHWEGDQLIVRATAATHDELKTLIQAWETSGLAQMSIECRFLTSPNDVATAAGIAWRSLQADAAGDEAPLSLPPRAERTIVQASARVEEHLPNFAVQLSPEQVRQITEIAQRDPCCNLKFAPKITLFNGQQALVSDCISRPYVCGFDEHPGQSPAARVKVIEQGTRLSLRSVLQADLRHIDLMGLLEITSISGVQQISSAMADGVQTIAVPRVTSYRLSIASPLEDGHSLLVGCLPSRERRCFVYVLLTVRRLILDGQ